MAAFYHYTKSGDVFGVVPGNSPISTAFDLEGTDLGVITSMSWSTDESVQYFLTFDDVINYIYFGRGVGSVQVDGIAFANCRTYDMPALKKFFRAVSSHRGRIMTVSVSGVGAFSGPLVNSNCTIVGDPDTMAQFSARIAMTSHTLGNVAPHGGC